MSATFKPVKADVTGELGDGWCLERLRFRGNGTVFLASAIVAELGSGNLNRIGWGWLKVGCN